MFHNLHFAISCQVETMKKFMRSLCNMFSNFRLVITFFFFFEEWMNVDNSWTIESPLKMDGIVHGPLMYNFLNFQLDVTFFRKVYKRKFWLDKCRQMVGKRIFVETRHTMRVPFPAN